MKTNRISPRPVRYKHKKKTHHVNEAIIRELMDFLNEKLSKERQKEKETLTRLIKELTQVEANVTYEDMDLHIGVTTSLSYGTTSGDLQQMFPELVNGIAKKLIETLSERNVSTFFD